MIFGVVLPTLKVSPSKAVPRTATVKSPLINPVIRDRSVPRAINAEDLIKLLMSPLHSSHALDYSCKKQDYCHSSCKPGSQR